MKKLIILPTFKKFLSLTIAAKMLIYSDLYKNLVKSIKSIWNKKETAITHRW